MEKELICTVCLCTVMFGVYAVLYLVKGTILTYKLCKNHNKSPKMGQVKKRYVLDAIDDPRTMYCHSISTLFRVYGAAQYWPKLET